MSTGTGTGEGWDDALAVAHAQLDAAERTLTGGEDAVALALPDEAELGPLPARLGPQAAALLERTRQLTDRVTAARDALRAGLRGRAAPDPGGTGSYLDTRA